MIIRSKILIWYWYWIAHPVPISVPQSYYFLQHLPLAVLRHPKNPGQFAPVSAPCQGVRLLIDPFKLLSSAGFGRKLRIVYFYFHWCFCRDSCQLSVTSYRKRKRKRNVIKMQIQVEFKLRYCGKRVILPTDQRNGVSECNLVSTTTTKCHESYLPPVSYWRRISRCESR